MHKDAAKALVVETKRALFGRYVNSLFKDHAFIRMAYKNMFQISPKMWRSSQPTPAHVAAAAKMGIKTIINLRGRRDDCGSYYLEKRACEKYGITLVDFPVNSRDAPKKEKMLEAREIWSRIEYPALMHCKAGSDRVGFMSALYLYVHEGVPIEQAVKQLHWRFGHLKQAKTGILDHFWETYRAHDKATPTEFFEWVEKHYDPVAFKAGFMAQWWANVLTDRIIRRE
ncbi:dual specificity protein phosphatase family protein [Aerophototrophica crusticola]|uniref:Dual specificity protein phosphatase family protein n=1 Tax=Aerophototrophica crusticola TaxID=1709002 RepID=A0A858R7Y1_9PROT|nr:dual specificity protein phosphatase family protein [Rhodospirillaceae bacterium B3]